MNMRKVCVAWAVITLVMVSAAFAQRPMGPPPFMGMGMRNQECKVTIPGNRSQRTEQTLACRCYMSSEGFSCLVMPRMLMARMDSMRMDRRDSMMGRMDRRPDSMRMRMRMHRDSVMGDSMPRRMGPPRRP